MTDSNSDFNNGGNSGPSDDIVSSLLLLHRDTENLKGMVSEKVQKITDETGKVESVVSGLIARVEFLGTQVQMLRAHHSSEAISKSVGELSVATAEVEKTVFGFPRTILSGTAQLTQALASLLALLIAAAVVIIGSLWSANWLADQLPTLNTIAYRFEAGHMELIPHNGALYVEAREAVTFCKGEVCRDFIRVGVAP